MESRKVEEYKSGYPRFVALLATHEKFLLCRRFDRLRNRVLLSKQDRLSVLEMELDLLDETEASRGFLASIRHDHNKKRSQVMAQIEACLTDYDEFIKRTSNTFRHARADGRDIANLQNWLDGNGCIAKNETSYLAHAEELISVAPNPDDTMMKLEHLVESHLIKFWRDFRKQKFYDSSIDENIYINKGYLVGRIAQGILLTLITFILLAPVLVCNMVTSTSSRIVVVSLSTIIYLLTLTNLTKSKTMELIIAASTYATVLVVFISGNNGVEG